MEDFLSIAHGNPLDGPMAETPRWHPAEWEAVLGNMESAVLKIDFSQSLGNWASIREQSTFNVTMADSTVVCTHPQRRDDDLFMEFPQSTQNAKSNGLTPKRADAEPKRLVSAFPEMRDYLRTARLRWIVDRCFQFKDGDASEWTYEICVGKKVTQFAGNQKAGKTIGKTLFEWGTYKIGHDQLWANGTLTQIYGNGTGGRQTEVFFECLDQYPTVTAIEEVRESELRMWVGASMFCDFRPTNPTPPLLEALLRPLEGWCANFTTTGFWSYEYCHPDSLVQFHKDSSGDVRDPMFLLGTLHKSTPSSTFMWKTHASADFPMLRGKGAGVNTNSRPKFRFLPVQLVDFPSELNRGREEKPQQVLAMELTKGTLCDSADVQRSTRVLFECPDDFATLATHQVMKVMETSPCHHELLIHTPLVCPHPRLLPPRPKEPQQVNCVPVESHQLDSPHVSEANHVKVTAGTAVDPGLEAIPSSYLPDGKISLNGSHFGMRQYKRSRSSRKSPAFRVGRLVRHRWSKYTAVVLSWDRSCEAPPDWTAKVYEHYPESSSHKPHYLLLVDQAAVREPQLPLFAYVPEVALEPAPAGQGLFRHPLTSYFFHHFSTHSGHFVPLMNTTIPQMFPEDFSEASQAIKIGISELNDKLASSLGVSHADISDRPQVIGFTP
ncbi:hemimethylated DNA binding domain-containing protein [Toxoplasma gondii]|uniref:Hemimethylated DNA binding domain-containing protein n=1 Tax=Toxoplasma gondii TaxID=5811 RepID=A0A7J6KDC7_TOXGO|nr:hemimethylated DNA binding domain-containing protein [Toxoplasma gondii]